MKMIKTLLIICLFSLFSYAGAGEWFAGRSTMYNWLKKQKDPLTVENLVIQDGWSSRNIDFVSDEHYRDEDFIFLTQAFKNVKSLKFNLNIFLTDASLEHLQELNMLEEIWLRDTYKITDQGLLAISKAAPQLKRLILEGSLPKIKGESLKEVFARLPVLEVLSVSNGIPHVNLPISWQQLSTALLFTNIQKLEFCSGYDTGATDEAVQTWTKTFSSMPSLQELGIYVLPSAQANTLIQAASRSDAPIHKLTVMGTSGALNEMDFQLSFMEGFVELRELHIKEWLGTSESLMDLGSDLKRLRPDIQIYVDGKKMSVEGF